MPDRVERPDASSIYKVLEADRTQDEEGSGNKQEAEENEKDRFNPSSNKTSKNIATASGVKASRLFSDPRAPKKVSTRRLVDDEGPDAHSWTWRIKHSPLKALGILSFEGAPRWGMIAMYLLGLTGLIVSSVLFISIYNG